MQQVVATPSSRSGLSRAVVLVVAMFATLIVISPPAGAATSCAPDSGGELIVRVDEAPGQETTIEVRSGVLFVNGQSCGTGPSILIVDDGAPKADRVVFNLAAGPFRMNGAAVFVQLFLDEHAPDGARDEVVIRGTSTSDVASLQSQIIAMARLDDFPGGDSLTLLMGIGLSAKPKLTFLLRGGPDTFWMGADSEGFFRGFVSVRGGSGEDELTGGPGRQRLRGGSGNDKIRGGDGNDKLWGNSGDDDVRGGKGDDVVKGGSGDDLLKGNSGDDTITGGKGFDRTLGGSGRDSLRTADGEKDRVRGGKGADTCDCDSIDNVKSAKRV